MAMKKYVSAFLALLCIFSLSAIAYAAPGETTAPDEIVLDRNFLSSSDMTEVDGNVVLTREIAAAPRTRSAAAECARESVVLIPSETSSAEEIMENIDTFLTSRAAGNKYEEEYDNTLSVKLYTTLYYTRKVENGKKYIKLTKVTGGTTDKDDIVTIVSQFLRMECQDRLTTSQQLYHYPTGTSFSFTTPSSWKYIEEDENLCSIGAYYEVTMKRGSSTGYWKYGMSNFLYLSLGSFS